MIRHIVFWKFRPDADPEPFLQALSALPEQIDWIRGMHVARSAAGTVQSIRAAAARWSWSTARPVGPAGTPCAARRPSSACRARKSCG